MKAAIDIEWAAEQSRALAHETWALGGEIGGLCARKRSMNQGKFQG
jgi:hypothetical protein